MGVARFLSANAPVRHRESLSVASAARAIFMASANVRSAFNKIYTSGFAEDSSYISAGGQPTNSGQKEETALPQGER